MRAILLVLVLLSGCTSAGPFVTNISSDGKGGITVEKSMVNYNMLLMVIGNKNHTSTNIQLYNDK